MEVNNHNVEQLHHFSCAVCGKWWTIGDAPEDKINWHCPWCGEVNTYESAE